MPHTISARWNEMHAVMVCAALVLAVGCGGQTGRVPSAPTPLPPTTPTPSPPTPVWKDLGEYTMTMTAAPSCSLPDSAMARTFNARLKESGRDLVAELDDQQHCVSWGWPCGFTGTKDAETVRFTLNGEYPRDDGYAFEYLVNGEDTALAYIGTATGKMTDGSISVVLNGAVLLYACRGFCSDRPLAWCDAADHRIELVRR
jgi:hypothetical protein